MVREHRVGHPGHAVHGDDGNHTGVEHVGLVDLLSAAEHDHQDTGQKHEHLDDEGHRQALLANHRAEFGNGTENGHDSHGAEEDPEAGPLLLGELNTDQGGGFAVDILALFRISNQGLELFVLVEVLAAEHGEGANHEQTDDSGRDHDGEQLREAEGLAADQLAVKQSHYRHSSHSSRRADHAHLSGDRGSSHRAFRTDVVLDGHVINNGQHRVNNVTRTAENRQEPAKIRSEVANETRMITKNLFSDRQQAVKTAGSLKGSARADHSHNGQNNVYRGLTGFETEAEDKDDEADTAHQTEGHTAARCSVEQAGEQHKQLHPEVKSNHCLSPRYFGTVELSSLEVQLRCKS